MARLSQLEVLDAGNIDVALPHLDVLSLAVEPGATNGAEAMRLVGQIERAELGESLLTLESVAIALYHRQTRELLRT